MGAILNNTAYEMRVSVDSDACTQGKIKISALMKLHEKIGELHLNVFGSNSDALRNEHNVAFIFTKTAILIHRLPLCNEEIIVKTWCSELKGVRFIRNYQTFDGFGNVLTEAKCEITTIDMVSRKIVRPASIPGFDGFLYNDELTNGCDSPKKISLPETLTATGVHKAKNSDIDSNHHVNNTVYADILMDALPDAFKETKAQSLEINFVSEVLEQEEIKVLAALENNEFFVLGVASDREVFRGKVWF